MKEVTKLKNIEVEKPEPGKRQQEIIDKKKPPQKSRSASRK